MFEQYPILFLVFFALVIGILFVLFVIFLLGLFFRKLPYLPKKQQEKKTNP